MGFPDLRQKEVYRAGSEKMQLDGGNEPYLSQLSLQAPET